MTFKLNSFLSPPSCDYLPEYTALTSALRQNPCISDTQIWHMFDPLRLKSHSCLQQLIRTVADYIASNEINGNNCRCSKDFERDVVHQTWPNQVHIWSCLHYNSNCKYLYDYFYQRHSQTHDVSRCQTHYHVWSHLKGIINVYGVDHQSELISQLSHTYSKGHENVCRCHKVQPHTHTHVHQKTTTAKPSMVKSSPAAPSTFSKHTITSSTRPTPTELSSSKSSPPITITERQTLPTSTRPTTEFASATTVHLKVDGSTPVIRTGKYSIDTSTTRPPAVSSSIPPATDLTGTNTFNLTSNCQKYMSVSGIADAEISSHPLAYLCPSGNRTSNEAFVLVNCNVGSPENWIEGPNVMKDCDRIHTYTPIATFGTEYLGVQEHEGLSGIFLGCIPGGFKMAYQDCDTSATIKHIVTGSGIDDPYNYFVVV